MLATIPAKAPEIVEFVSQLADVCNNITTRSPELIDFAGHSSNRLLSMRICVMILAQKWHCGGNFHGKIKLDDVELTAIVDLGDVHDVTPLVLFVDSPLALTNDEHIVQFALIVLRPFRPSFITGVEESWLGVADSAKASIRGGIVVPW